MIDTTLPLTDLHRHLDGNIRPETILDLGREFSLSLPADTLEGLRMCRLLRRLPTWSAF